MKIRKSPAGQSTRHRLERVVRAPESKWRSATLCRELKGEFSTWKKGEVVWACQQGKTFIIERMKRKPSGILKEGLTCLNVFAGVPRSVIELHDVWRSNESSSATGGATTNERK